MVTAFMGMRGTGDWATDERPKNWRQGILRLYPNGNAPLTGLLSKMAEEETDDPEFNWWTKLLPPQAGAITGVYTNSGLSVAYTSGGVAGDTLYIKMALATADEIRAGHQVLLRDTSHLDVDVNAKVTAITKNGASSYATVKLLEADDNGSAVSKDLSDADKILVIGSINAEGAPMPEAIAYDPDKWYNYTQIFRTPLEITRTARRTKLRTADAYAEAKREALELHSIEMEKAFFWGIRTENVGANGKPERTTMGLISAIRSGAASNVKNFTLDSEYSGDTWAASGETWLDQQLEVLFRYGAKEKLAFAGSGAVLGINKLAKISGQIQLQSTTVSYGLKVMQWITPFGTIYLMTHPLFSYDDSTRNTMVLLEPAMLRYRYVDDTRFYGQPQSETSPSHERYDGTKEEWLTECGLEYHHPSKFMFLQGLNTDNTV